MINGIMFLQSTQGQLGNLFSNYAGGYASPSPLWDFCLLDPLVFIDESLYHCQCSVMSHGAVTCNLNECEFGPDGLASWLGFFARGL